MKKIYYLDGFPRNSDYSGFEIAAIYYFEIDNEHWNSLKNDDMIEKYKNIRLVKKFKDNPARAKNSTPFIDGLMKGGINDDPHDLFAEIFEDNNYLKKKYMEK